MGFRCRRFGARVRMCLKKSNVKTYSFKIFKKTLNKQTLNMRERKDKRRKFFPSSQKRRRKETLCKRRTLSTTFGVCVCVCVCVRARADHAPFFHWKRLLLRGGGASRHHHERWWGDIVVVESVCQSRPVAKTPSAHADVQTHVPGVLFRRGHVRNLLRLREGEGQEEDALKKRRGVKELVWDGF